MDISLVVPLYNEAESLPELMSWIDKVMKEHEFSYEILMVDDGSTDESWKAIEKLSTEYPGLRAFKFGRNYGKSAALQVGFQATRGEVVITMDADLQDSPDEIPELYRMIKEEGYDLVSGWKKKRYDPLSKRLPSKFFNFITRKVSGIKLHDFNCGLKAYKQEVVKSIELYGEMHRQIPLMAKYSGFYNIGEKVVEHRARKYGVTKFGLNRFINGFLDLFSLVFTQRYLKKPMHFFGTWGVLFAIIGASTLIYLAFIKLVMGEGLGHRIPALMFGAVTLLLGFILFSTGLLGEMISRTDPNRNQYRISARIGEKEVV